jgi:flagellar basal-body rod protein FlgF
MIKGIGSAGSALKPMMTRLDVLANNLANLNSTGFKRDNLFTEALSDAALREAQGRGELSGSQSRQYTDLSEGSVQQTGNPLDLAIQGRGFFTVETPRGVRYTRNGSFSLSREGLLVTSEGYPVLGTNGVISFPDPQQIGAGAITVSEQGEVAIDKRALATLRMSDFDNALQLTKDGNTLFRAVGPEKRMDPGVNPARVRQGCIEESNVDGVEEMIAMIELTREFESNQKAIQQQDATLDKTLEVGRM